MIRCTCCGNYCDDDNIEAPICEECSERIYAKEYEMPSQDQELLRSVLVGMQQLAQRNLSLTIREVYDALEPVIPEDADKSRWSYDGYNTTLRDGIAGDDGQDNPALTLRFGIGGGCMWLEVEGGFSDVETEAFAEIYIDTGLVTDEDDDPRCVCGVYRSEHMMMGCSDGFQTQAEWEATKKVIASNADRQYREEAGFYDYFDREDDDSL